LLNETRLIDNLSNQNFNKNNSNKIIKHISSISFLQHEADIMPAINNIRDLNYLLKSGVKYTFLNNSYINEIKGIQESSKELPLKPMPKLNSEATISTVPLKRRLIKIIEYEVNESISFMYNLLIGTWFQISRLKILNFNSLKLIPLKL